MKGNYDSGHIDITSRNDKDTNNNKTSMSKQTSDTEGKQRGAHVNYFLILEKYLKAQNIGNH
eukprot:3431613-Ditylum_brightwellii.AAC.1